jgi:endonuclease G
MLFVRARKLVCKLGLLSLLMCLSVATSRAEDRVVSDEALNQLADSNSHVALGVPSQDLKVVVRDGYVMGYDDKKEEIAWVSMQLKKGQTATVRNTAHFYQDPMFPKATLPSKQKQDMELTTLLCGIVSRDAVRETQFKTLAVPMTETFRKGLWKQMAAQLNSWLDDNNELNVTFATVENEENVPDSIAVVVVADKGKRKKAIGLTLSQDTKSVSKSIKDMAVSIDHIEEETGFDFLNVLKSKEEKELEKEANTEEWKWESKKVALAFAKEHLSANGSFVATEGGKRVHKQDCHFVERMNDDNMISFETYQDAVNSGYTPCKVCKPDQ